MLNKQTKKHILKAKEFCEYFASVNVKDEIIKKNLLTTAKGLEVALAIVDSLDELNIKA